MAKKQVVKSGKLGTKFVFLKSVCCCSILACCCVLFIGGVSEGVRTSKIIYNCIAVSFGIALVYGIALWAMTKSEEIKGGQA